jgi:hypothetical protein
MKILWFKDILKGWDNTTWVTGWAMVGEIRELCIAQLPGTNWKFVNEDGSVSDRLPHGICFEDDEAATVFKLLI